MRTRERINSAVGTAVCVAAVVVWVSTGKAELCMLTAVVLSVVLAAMRILR